MRKSNQPEIDSSISFELKAAENNPYPVLAIDCDGSLVFYNTASEYIVQSWKIKVGSQVPEDVLNILCESVNDEAEIHVGKKTYLFRMLDLEESLLINLYAMDVTERLAIEKFPEQNPNPVLRTDLNGSLKYANQAAEPIIESWGIKIGELVPDLLILNSQDCQSVQVSIDCGYRSYSFNVVPVTELDYVNIYGTDVTAVNALTKFPDQNPNPVFRCDMNGVLLYANPAAEFIRSEWEINEGDSIPNLILESMKEESDNELEIEVGARIYKFITVTVPAFDFRNIYGTDITALKDNERILRKLAKYFSPQVYTSIFSGDLEVAITTKRKRLTVFFSDIKGFSTITEQLEPEALTELITDYLTAMTEIAVKHGGTVDKYIGDAIMVFFGDPHSLGSQEDALACVRMAIEMKEKMYAIQKGWREKGISQPMDIRIGIHTDICTVGNFGSHDRLDYTTIGNGVNLASRLESNANPNQILISEDTYLLVQKEIECIELGPIPVKNISHPINTFEVKNEVSKTDQPIDIGGPEDGFSLYLDPNAVQNIEEKREILEKAIILLNKI